MIVGAIVAKASLLGNTRTTGVEPPNCSPIEETNHGPTQFSGSACRFAFFPANGESRRSQKTSEDLDEKRVGTRRSDQGHISFSHGLVLAEAGHDVQIFLLAEATSLMRKATANAILPVGWQPLSETLEKLVAKHIPIFA
jgi:hypothetical protein